MAAYAKRGGLCRKGSDGNISAMQEERKVELWKGRCLGSVRADFREKGL